MNVVEAAYTRIAKLYEKYDKIIVGFSGGKDCTALLKICIDVARQKNRLPVDVFFLDQEVEYPDTIEFVRRIMYLKEVKPHWLQVYFKESWCLRASGDGFLKIYDPSQKDNWIFEKDPIAIQELPFRPTSIRFGALLTEYIEYLANNTYKGLNICTTDGITMFESLNRRKMTRAKKSFSGVSWCKRRGSVMGYSPLFDWRDLDVFKFLIDTNTPYNRIYDKLFKVHKDTQKLRVSSLIHETAINSIDNIRELTSESYIKRLYDRCPEIVSKYQEKNNYYFNDTVQMIVDMLYNGNKEKYLFAVMDDLLQEEAKNSIKSIYKKAKRVVVLKITDYELQQKTINSLQNVLFNEIVCNDYCGTKISNFLSSLNYVKRK